MNNRLILGCCAFAVILSILSIVLVSVKTNPCSASVLVAILGILVTVLIGWQIFMVVDFRNYEKKISELRNELNMKIKELDDIREGYKGVGFHAFSEFYYFLRVAMNGPKGPCVFRQMSWMLYGIESLVLTGNLLRVRREYKHLCEIVETNIPLAKSDIEHLLQIWDASVSNIVRSPYYSNPDFREIVDGVTNQLKTLTATQQ